MSEDGSAQRSDTGGRRPEEGGERPGVGGERPGADRGRSRADRGPSGADGERDELYEELRAYEGHAAATSAHGRDPVNEPMIRHWCEAMGHPVPRDGSAPATMLQVWTMAGLGDAHAGSVAESGTDREGTPERNGGGGGRAAAYDALLGALDSAGYTSVVATDCEQEYPHALRPGDTVSFDAVIESVSPRKTTKLGTGYFVTTRMDIHAGGRTAGTHRFRILKYRPAHARKDGAPSTGAASEARTDSAAADTARADKGERPARRPRPVVNRDNAGFWEGVSAHELLIQRCDACGTPRFPWLPGCNACGSQDWTPFAATGRGTVYSYVIMHHPAFPAFDPPYAVALVELEEGVRIVSNITGVAWEKVRIGMPVELEFLRVDDECELPVFRGTGTA